MGVCQRNLILIYATFAFIGFVKGFSECKNKKNSYGKAHIFNLIGAFVWGDAVVFGLFWALVSMAVLLLNDWVLFLLTLSVFWAVRSLGETIYWFNQQFSKVDRNSPEKFWFYKIFQNDSVWFVYQIYWQCVTVISIILSIYLAHLWLGNL